MCGPGQDVEMLIEIESDNRLDEYMKRLKELSDSVLLYHEEGQWVLLERANKSGVPSIINVHTDPTARALSKFVGSKME